MRLLFKSVGSLLVFLPLIFASATTLADEDQENQIVEKTLAEDKLGTQSGMPWGGDDLPYSKVVEIQDGLIDAPVGRVVLDRHGEEAEDVDLNNLIGSLFDDVFSAPRPGSSVFISLWGSKIEGCFTELILQVAPNGEIDPQNLVATSIEIGVNGQIIRLVPQEADPKVGSYQYSYISNEQQYNAIWYMSRQLFVVDETIANILSNAPEGDIKARINLANNSSILFPIGKKTVERWKHTYSFNAACKSPQQAQQ
jgi:hypothetical protein